LLGCGALVAPTPIERDCGELADAGRGDRDAAHEDAGASADADASADTDANADANVDAADADDDAADARVDADANANGADAGADTAAPDADAASPDANDADSGPWSPSSLAGLVLWLDGASGLSTTSTQVTWRDRSPAKNDAVSTGSVSILTPAIGGLPAAHLDGNGYLSVADSASLQFGTGDYFIAIVARHTTPTDNHFGYGLLFSKQDVPYPFAGPCVSANAVNSASNPNPPTTGRLLTQTGWNRWVTTNSAYYDSGTPFMVTVRRFTASGQATLRIRANGSDVGQLVGSQFAIDVSARGQPLNIGGTSQNQNLVGDIAEEIAVRGAMSDDDALWVEGYLKTKYAL
jgi:hypothetical protein